MQKIVAVTPIAVILHPRGNGAGYHDLRCLTDRLGKPTPGRGAVTGKTGAGVRRPDERDHVGADPREGQIGRASWRERV